MDKKKIRLAFVFCIALFVLALLLSLLFAEPTSADSIILSEIVASNRTCPAPNGNYLDYIEVHNASSDPVDISGFMLSDKPDTIGYTFPQGSVIPAGGYLVCWCDKNAQSDSYGLFGISNDGTDYIYLYNSANVVIDQVQVPVVGTNTAYIRMADGSWSKGTRLTPGFANTEEGYRAWMDSAGVEQPDVVISEVLPGADCFDADGSGRRTDWVELYNRGTTDADLSGAYLTDDEQDVVKWQIPQLVLQPGERVVIRCAGDEAQAGEADFLLSREGGVVILSGKMGNLICRTELPKLGKDISWVRGNDDSYSATEYPTPGHENTEVGYNAWLSSQGLGSGAVISEVMSANYGTLISADGKMSDWVELYNPGSTAVDLSGGYLSNDADQRGKWQLGNLVLQPGERKVIFCSGLEAPAGEATFAISRDGTSILLSGKAGNLLCKTDVPAMDRDRVWVMQADGTYTVSDQPTPGYENTEDGRALFLKSQAPGTGLVINEAMPSNSTYYRQSDGKCYDWVELYNASDAPIDLSDYTLSNDPDQPGLLQLPMQMLQPGQYVVIICSGNTELDGGYIHAPFTLSRSESWVYLTGMDGKITDVLAIRDVPNNGSVGRVQQAGTYYFTKPTPAAPNATGVLFISATPTAVTESGIYNDVSSVRVELSGENLRYTTDGSIPTAGSTPYTGPILLDKTTVVRFASFESGKIPSDIVTAPYIINENHTLPVVSMATEPGNLFGSPGLYQNYTSEQEVPCNITLFEENGGFSIDCGLKMFGHMGLTLPKKSFKINFRGRYGTDMLTYPVYGEDGPQIYDSLVIRSGQDYPNTIFRDEFFTSLCRDAGTNVLAQRDKHVILYINGTYWGIYTIKEAFGETMYAENYNVSTESVTVQQAPFGPDAEELFTFMRWCRSNDLSDPDNYAYFCSMMDVDSLIDWMIFQGYCANTDIQQNLRYFKSSENGGKWQFAYYDLDWGWYFHNGFINLLSPTKNWQHMAFCKAPFANSEFRERFFTRMAELKDGVLSDEYALKRIDYYADLLRPEIAREKDRWGGTYEDWERNVEKMKAYLTQRDHWGHLMTHMRSFVGMTNAEYKKYFGG